VESHDMLSVLPGESRRKAYRACFHNCRRACNP